MLLFLSACGSGGGSEADNPAVISGSNQVTRLQVIDTVEGSGATASSGDSLTVHYEGWLFDINEPDFHGTMFDSTIGGDPYTFRLGQGEVIAGWDQGLVGMRVGGKRTLIVPAYLGFGRSGNGPIPPNAALVFDVELVDVD